MNESGAPALRGGVCLPAQGKVPRLQGSTSYSSGRMPAKTPVVPRWAFPGRWSHGTGVRRQAEGFRVVPFLSVKRAKPEGSFWIYDDWRPLLATVRAMVDELGIDGIQLDPEPLNVRDVPALNTGLGWLAGVLGGRELGVATHQLVDVRTSSPMEHRSVVPLLDSTPTCLTRGTATRR